MPALFKSCTVAPASAVPVRLGLVTSVAPSLLRPLSSEPTSTGGVGDSGADRWIVSVFVVGEPSAAALPGLLRTTFTVKSGMTPAFNRGIEIVSLFTFIGKLSVVLSAV